METPVARAARAARHGSRRCAPLAALWIAIAGCQGARGAEPPPSLPVAAKPAPAPPAPEPTWDTEPLRFATSRLPPRATLRIRGQFALGERGAALSLDPSGRRLAVSRGPAVDVIDVDARPPRRSRLERPGTRVEAVAFSPDGAQLAVGFAPAGSPWDPRRERHASVRLFDVESGDEVQKLEGVWVFAYALSFSADGRRLLSAGSSLCVWNAAEGTREQQIDAFTEIHHAVLSADGRVVVAMEERRGDPDGPPPGVHVPPSPPRRLLRWDAGSATPVTVPDRGVATQMALGADGTRLLLAAPEAPGLVVIALDSGRQLAQHLDPARRAVISPDGSRVAVAGLDQRIRLYTFPDLREVGKLLGHGPPEIEALAFSQDGRRLVSATATEILVWALDEGAAP